MPPSRRRPLWVTVADAVLDGSIVAFAVWTVLYEVATAFRLSAWGTGIVWIPLAILSVAACVVRGVSVHGAREDEHQDAQSADLDGGRSRQLRLLVASGVALALLAGLAALLTEGRLAVWLLTLAASVVLLAAVSVTTAVRRAALPSYAGPDSLAQAGAALVVLGLTVAMMFVLNPSADDIYYVNRSVWVAEQGTFSLRDTMFGAERFPATYGGGLPVASIEGLVGALAQLLGVSAATLSYLGVQPVGCLLAGWATWRLVRAWAPRRALLVLVGAVLFSLFSATGTIGDFSYARMWQGKVLGFAVLLPVAWLHLTRLARAQDRRAQVWSLVMLAVSGLAFVGLTATAVLLAPAVAAAALLAAVALEGARRRLAAGAVAFSAFPVLAGLAVVVLSAGVGAGTSGAPSVERVLRRVLGQDPCVVAVAVLALGLAPLLARGRSGRTVAGASAAASLALLTPGVLDLLGAVTGSGPVLYRLLMVAPVPVLVGLLLAAPAPSAVPLRWRRAVPALCAVTLTTALVVGGTPPWSKEVGGRWTGEPTWKWHLAALPEVRGVLRLDPGAGPVLLPRQHMKTLPLITTRTAAVSPRNYYLASLDEPRRLHRARRLLAHMMAGSRAPVPPQQEVTEALEVLEVTLVCAARHRDDLLTVFRGAGYGEPARAGRLICLRRS